MASGDVGSSFAGLRVGVIGPTEPDTFADNIAAALRRMGVEVVALGPATPRPSARVFRSAIEVAERQTAEMLQWMQRAVARRAGNARCDVVINVQQSLMPAAVEAIRRSGAKVALWFPDAVSNMQRMAMVAAPYDALFVKDHILADRLASVYGLPAHYLPEACSPTWHRPRGAAGSEPWIAVVGSLYPTRARLLHRLDSDGIPLRIHGAGYPRWYRTSPLERATSGPFVTREAKADVFRSARGVLNNLHPGEMDSVNARLFEAAGSGGAVLNEYREVLPTFFTPGEEVLAFASYDELLAQCTRLLEDDGLTARIGDAAHRRAHSEHTYAHRLPSLLEKLA
jgi:spore maturation protein CgeB